MKTKILILLVILFGLGVGGFFVYQNFFAPQEFYKGVWMPSLGASVIPKELLPDNLLPEGVDVSVMEPVFADFDKASDAGINTFATQMSYWANENGELTMPPSVKEFMASFIDRAHARGFKVWLNPEILHYMKKGDPSMMRQIPESWLENTNLLENYKLAIIETAKFAAEHDVEIFSPSSEMFVNIGHERTWKLLAEIKPSLDKVYKGKICVRGEWSKPELSMYSCFGPTIGAPRNEKEKKQLIDNIDFSITREDVKAELILAEIWEGNDWQGTPEEAKRNIESVLEVSKGKVSGVFILDTGRTYIQLFPDSFESTVKEFYSKL